MTHHIFDDLLGKTIWNIEHALDANNEIHSLNFQLDDLSLFSMYDEEYGSGNDVSVRVVDIEGTLDDLIGEPLTVAEYVSGETYLEFLIYPIYFIHQNTCR